MKRLLWAVLILGVILALPAAALAQTYSFTLERETVHVFWNEDGSASIDYAFTFANDNWADPIEFVDVGLPNDHFVVETISADVDGHPVAYISESEFQGLGGSGVAVALGSAAIQPGERGLVHVFIGIQNRMLRPDSEDSEYASAVFSPTWFGSEYVHDDNNLTVVFHMPPGVQPEEPRWHASPDGWATQPDTGFDSQGRITYTWSNARATGYTQYFFGASFPRKYVPTSAISRPSLFEILGISPDDAMGFTVCCAIGLFIILSSVSGIRSSAKRKLKYLPPKVAIEGHGIKRGLTAVEAAILLEQPLDKVLTMILFSAIKKEAATVVDKDPLKLSLAEPLPDTLHPYEKEFLTAFKTEGVAARRKEIQEMVVNLVKSVSEKMKGFSRKETLAYYKEITQKAWAQVEAAGTPEVKSAKFDQVMEWTMLDRDYDDRTRRVFTGGPVFIPTWWGRYDPTFSPGRIGPAVSPSGGGVSLPHLPGSDFAASVVNGVQNFSGNVIGNLSDFTSKVTNKTNPIPVSTGSSGGRRSSGGGCACACACAGCACACAGGGR
ncbi:MAG: hypothetical protein L0Z70_15565 [Chloroflexi bacterium]|nr:hypothetical protein [Chloroflexota bacterium]